MIKAAARVEWQKLVESRQKTRPVIRYLAPLALAASLILALAVGWWWMAQQTPVDSEPVATVELVSGEIRAAWQAGGQGRGRPALAVADTLVAGTEIATVGKAGGSTARMALRLRGGHSLRVDGDSRVRLLSTHRIELQRGAVYLDSGVERLTGSGVEVVTPLGIVREIGTQFEVRLQAQKDGGVRVRVREGSVSLREDGQSFSVASGEELTLRRDGSVARGSIEPYGPEWDWILAAAPSLDIEGLMLSAFLEWVSRETGWRVRYSNEELAGSAATIRLHGTIDGLAPHESLSVVLPGSGLGYRLESGSLLITRPPGDGASS